MGSLKLTVISTTRSTKMTTTNTDASRTTSVESSRTSENNCTFTPEKDNEEDCRESFSIAIDTSRSSIVDNFVSMAHQEANFVPGRWERNFRQMTNKDTGTKGLCLRISVNSVTVVPG